MIRAHAFGVDFTFDFFRLESTNYDCDALYRVKLNEFGNSPGIVSVQVGMQNTRGISDNDKSG